MSKMLCGSGKKSTAMWGRKTLKAEARNPKEIQLAIGFLSDFGFRISDLPFACARFAN